MDDGRKQLRATNWLDRDPVLDMFVRVRDGKELPPLTGEERLARILGVTLHGGVPEDVRGIFAVARAAMIYGYFYYPLYTVGPQHAYGAVEAAVAEKCKQVAITGRMRGLHAMTTRLHAAGHISDAQLAQLESLRELRNDSAHPRFQSTFPPGMAQKFLRDVAEAVNSLFQPPPEQQTTP